MAQKEVLWVRPDDPAVKQAARMSDEALTNTYRIQEAAYAEVRKVLERMGVPIGRDDIWPTIENRMTKLHISVLHDYDPATIGTPDDKGGWFFSKDDVLKAIVPHPRIVNGRIEVYAVEAV